MRFFERFLFAISSFIIVLELLYLRGKSEKGYDRLFEEEDIELAEEDEVVAEQPK